MNREQINQIRTKWRKGLSTLLKVFIEKEKIKDEYTIEKLQYFAFYVENVVINLLKEDKKIDKEIKNQSVDIEKTKDTFSRN